MPKRVAAASESFPNVNRDTPLPATLRATLLQATAMCFESIQRVNLAQPDLSEEGCDAGH
jgi:hypothetical protein